MDYEIESDVGRKRTVNEDEAAVFTHPNGEAMLAVIADGMGGHRGGDFASSTAIKMIGERFTTMDLSEVECAEDWQDWMYDMVVDVNKFLFTQSQKHEEYKGMGTTLDLALILQSKCIIFHVGDSRVYRITGEEIEQITKDHSFVNVLVDSGEITEEEAEVHPQRNWIMKAVGSEQSIVPDFHTIQLCSNSYLMLCTDGLSNKVEKETILEIVTQKLPLKDKVDTLVQLANERGGEDNITVILIAIPEIEVAPQ